MDEIVSLRFARKNKAKREGYVKALENRQRHSMPLGERKRLEQQAELERRRLDAHHLDPSKPS